jgi:hypothetical protein
MSRRGNYGPKRTLYSSAGKGQPSTNAELKEIIFPEILKDVRGTKVE